MKKILAFVIAASIAVSSAFAADSSADQKKKAKTALKEVTWTVNLHCDNCVNKVNENIAFEKGVKDLKVSLEEGTVYIKYDSSKTTEEKLAAAMKKLGYEVAAECNCGHDHGEKAHDHEGHDHEGHDHNHKH